MVYYEAQCESVGGTIWCLPLGVVTAIILPLDWQKKNTACKILCESGYYEENLNPKQHEGAGNV